MPAPVKSLEDRVADLESIYLDMPDILNTRFDKRLAGVEERLGCWGSA